MRARSPEQRRAKVSVTVEPRLLQAVDSFIAAHPEFDRSKVVDDALALWYASQQEQAMERQFAAPISEREREERAAWRPIRRAAAARRFGSS